VDHYRFTHEPDDEESERTWSTREEERTFLRIRDLLMRMHDRGSGIYIMPVQQGMQAAGGGEGETYGVDGWAVGEFGAGGGQDLAIGPWLDQVVEAAGEAAR
jgi:hypothetical protein